MDDLFRQELVHSKARSIAASLLESSSDEESENTTTWGGSKPGKSPNKERYREIGAQRLYDDYFSNSPVHDDKLFQRRFRITKQLYYRVMTSACSVDTYFQQRKDCTGRVGLSTHQKVTCALRLLAYGSAADSVEEYLRIGESTSLNCLKRFSKAVVKHFGAEYLRYPTPDDIKAILKRSAGRWFPGCIGSIDCCKWIWKNCPTALHGQYQGKEGEPAITLEAIADDRLWIWHAFFGMPGSLNDINVLEASPLSNEIAAGNYLPPVEYQIAGQIRIIPYWLADGIYPKWPLFVHTASQPKNEKEKLLAPKQEASTKDVERAFGVLKARWHVLERPGRLWYKDSMHDVIRCCIILHNLMVEHRIINEDEDIQDNTGDNDHIVLGSSYVWSTQNTTAGEEAVVPPPGSIAALCALQRLTKNEQEYSKTRSLVIKHLWDRRGNMFE